MSTDVTTPRSVDARTSPAELHRRLLYSFMRPAARLARRFGVDLKGLVELARLAYFEELRRGLTQAEAAEAMGVSKRTVATLESQFKSDFLAPENEIEYARRVEDALPDGEGDGVSAKTVADQLGEADDLGRVRRTLEGLAAAGRVEARPANGAPQGDRRYLARRGFVSLVRSDLKSRIDGLNHILGTVEAAVLARLAGDDPRPAVARTLSLIGTDETMSGLTQELVRDLRRRSGDAEEDALSAGGADRYAVTLVLAPLPPEAADL